MRSGWRGVGKARQLREEPLSPCRSTLEAARRLRETPTAFALRDAQWPAHGSQRYRPGLVCQSRSKRKAISPFPTPAGTAGLLHVYHFQRSSSAPSTPSRPRKRLFAPWNPVDIPQNLLLPLALATLVLSRFAPPRVSAALSWAQLHSASRPQRRTEHHADAARRDLHHELPELVPGGDRRQRLGQCGWLEQLRDVSVRRAKSSDRSAGKSDLSAESADLNLRSQSLHNIAGNSDLSTETSDLTAEIPSWNTCACFTSVTGEPQFAGEPEVPPPLLKSDQDARRRSAHFGKRPTAIY